MDADRAKIARIIQPCDSDWAAKARHVKLRPISAGIWAKDRLVMGRGHYHWQHEPCWYAVRGTGHWAGDRKQITLWNIPTKDPVRHNSPDVATVHGTQKPVECMRRPMVNNSSPGQAVYEPFSGSGTTIIATEMEGRVCHAVELSPAYVDVAVRRWEAFTGQTAVLDDGGASFASVAAERGPQGRVGGAEAAVVTSTVMDMAVADAPAL